MQASLQQLLGIGPQSMVALSSKAGDVVSSWVPALHHGRQEAVGRHPDS